MTQCGSPLPQHVFPFSLIRYDVMTGEPIRNAQGHCVATSPGLYVGWDEAGRQGLDWATEVGWVGPRGPGDIG